MTKKDYLVLKKAINDAVNDERACLTLMQRTLVTTAFAKSLLYSPGFNRNAFVKALADVRDK
jgi:hypothetical protein